MSRQHRLAIAQGFRALFFAFGILCILSIKGWAVPSFARQTGMACAACHTVFPELTPFGREFKLNGYVLDNIKQITGINTSDRQTMAISSIPPVSLMLQVSYTHTGSALPDSTLPGAEAASRPSPALQLKSTADWAKTSLASASMRGSTIIGMRS